MIKESTLKFLRDLKKNNNREWFEENRSKYEDAKKDFEQFVDELIKALAKSDPPLKDLQAKDCVFRIYRDVRFSKNKDPYKTNFGASIKKGGRRSPYCGFYFQIEPQGEWGTFLAGGYWMPESALLKKIRQEIEYNHEEFIRIIENKTFKKHFALLEDHKLKKLPKGIPADHPAGEYLKYTSFIASRSINSKQLKDPKFIKECEASYKAMLPLINFLNRVNDDQ
ncbi:MAG: DUF2461 domain-containing protein [Bacteroidetes bacterium]|nr:DUF2461 domain-containing protein [Bacteroidota bacterium]MBL0097052.1 DUF2461 domain-containing protein [Bacteroidota bacterium]